MNLQPMMGARMLKRLTDRGRSTGIGPRAFWKTQNALVKSASDIRAALNNVNSRIKDAIDRRSKLVGRDVRLVAVSKLKPKSSIIEAYNCGQKCFGENYVQELFEKANDPEITEKCPEIKWHFIGSLQKSGINKLLRVPRLDIVETCHSFEIATSINDALERKNYPGKLKVMMQVNTSEEPSKHGVSILESVGLATYITKSCTKLDLVGLMTIGSLENSTNCLGINPDFQKLVECRERICEQLELNQQDLELSMGMSSDFEHAIELGSTNVRVGTTIFGARNKSD